MKNRNLITCIILNAIIIIFCGLGIGTPYITYHGFTSIEMRIKLYEFDTSILLMVSSLIFIVFASLVITRKIKFIPNWVYILKFVTTTAMTMMMSMVILLSLIDTFTGHHTFDVTLFYTNANLYFHLLIPIMSIVSYLFFEKPVNKIRFLQILYVFIPVILYFVLYISFALAHEQDGTVPVFYDPYGFCLHNTSFIWLYCCISIGFTYFFGWLLWLGNKKINLFRKV